MLVNITGAKVKKYEDGYIVEYKEQTIFKSKTKEVAVSIALSKNTCENLLTSVLKSV